MSVTSKTYSPDEAETLSRTSTRNDDGSFELVAAMTDRLLALVVPALVIWLSLMAFHA
jgi:hypothetical protein